MHTGYIGSVSLLHAIADLAAELRARAPGGTFTYLCDPVMGDEGRLYVAAEMVDAFRERLVPLASVMVPNSYEATLLTGVDVCSVEDALRACDALHARGPHTVVREGREGGSVMPVLCCAVLCWLALHGTA